jgi:hypothetical protein
MGRPPHGVGKNALKRILVHIPIGLIAWADRRGPTRATVFREALEFFKASVEADSKKPKD